MLKTRKEMEEVGKNFLYHRKTHTSRYLAVGRVGSRIITLVIRRESQGKYYVVTARDASRKERRDVYEKGRSGVTRARKLAALKEWYEFMVNSALIPSSPAEVVSMPIREKKQRVYLRPDEYVKLLSAAGGNPRDFCILQLFLQTGIRVGELVNLKVSDIDLEQKTMTIRSGKGKKERVMDLEKRGLLALKNYLNVRSTLQDGVLDDSLFLNYQGIGISDRGLKAD